MTIGGIDIATLKEQGIDVDLVNWRGVVAPPGLSDEDRNGLLEVVDKMAASDGWQSTLKQRAWMDTYLSGQDFADFLSQDQERVAAVLKDIGLVQ